MEQQTTDKDLHWFFDGPIPSVTETPEEPISTPDVEQTDSEPIDGSFSEEIEGEVVDAPKPRGVPIKWLIPIGVGALLIALTVLVVVLPIIQASATILITPDRQRVEVSTTLSVQARKLFTRSLTLAQTVKSTGTAHQNASVATGYLTFYNSLPSPQTIPAGTLITGADGVNIITEQDADIPAGALSVNGQVTVSAHTTIAGAQANIQAGDINGACCRDYVFARNGQFSGGRAARNYRTATTADIQAATQDLNKVATGAFASQAQGQLQPNEASLPPQCTRKTEPSQNPGAEAAQITVSLAGVCSYHLSRSELLAVQNLVAGKSQAQATSLLLHPRGVKTAGVQIAHGGQTLPPNPDANA